MSAVQIRPAFAARGAVPALALAILLAAPSQAAGATQASSEGQAGGPVITSPSEGAGVSGTFGVTVATEAPEVLIIWADEAHVEDAHYLHTVQPVDGVAAMSLSSSGYAGLTSVLARECRRAPHPVYPDNTVTICDGAETSVSVEVSNSPPAFDSSGWLEEVRPEDSLVYLAEGFDEAWDARAYFGFFIDGALVPPVWGDPFFGYYTDAFSEGLHTMQAARCTEISGEFWYAVEAPRCDMANASEVRTFRIRKAFYPKITSVSSRVISPDGNGVHDKATVTLELEAPPQSVVWSLNHDGVAMESGYFRSEGGESITIRVTGRDRDGAPLPSGDYQFKVFASNDDGNGRIHGSTSTPMRIDRHAPRVTDVSATPQVLHPRPDGFKDRVRIAGTLSEPASRLRVEIRRAGAVRRTLYLGPQPAGEFSTTWDGKRPHGKLVVAGTYRYRFVAVDRWGNRAVRPGGEITVRR